eukprot:363500-Chlamydomonas_euryale.AAC.12
MTELSRVVTYTHTELQKLLRTRGVATGCSGCVRPSAVQSSKPTWGRQPSLPARAANAHTHR